MSIYRFEEWTPEIAATAWVAPGAQIMGRIVLEAETSIWFGAVLRGDNEPIVIGEGSNVQENCVLHTDPGYPLTVGREVTVGHSAILHGCTIGEGALIGMGACVMNGAVIGPGAMVGAGALVTEGKEIPAGMLALGSPAKPVRQLDLEAKKAFRAGALGYKDKASRFRTGLVPLD